MLIMLHLYNINCACFSLGIADATQVNLNAAFPFAFEYKNNEQVQGACIYFRTSQMHTLDTHEYQ